MFQLIISILAIILAVALAGVSVYYGGSAFSNGSEKAEYATLTNESAQIEAAITLYRAQEGTDAFGQTDDAGTTDVDESNYNEVLEAGDYLKQTPAGYAVSADFLVNIGAADAVCDVSEQVDVTMATPGTLTTAAEATGDADVLAAMTGVSGCFSVTNATVPTQVFYYSL